MTDIQIGIYFMAGFLSAVFCGLLKNGKLVWLMKNFVLALLAFAILYTILSLVYFVFMKQLGPSMAWVFIIGGHKVIIFFIDGIIIACFLARFVFLKTPLVLLTDERGLRYNFSRYFMAAYFSCSGVSKIIGFSAILGFFQLSGYSVFFLCFIITFEIIFGIALLFTRMATIASLLLIVEMAGATFTHYHNYFEHQVPGPFSNSLDSLKMLPFLVGIALIYNPNRNSVRTMASPGKKS